MKRNIKMTLPLVAFGVAVSHAQAQDAASEAAVAQLPALVVKGQGQDERQVSLDQVQRNISFDMKDIFRDVPGVVVGGGARNAQRIYLDGVEGTNLNITVDGARQGRALFQHRGGMTGMDPDLLKRVEVMTGGGGAETGPGALGGAIQIQTVDAQDLLEDGRLFGERLKTGYASADKARRGSLSVYGMAGEKLGLLAHVSAVNYDDYRLGGGDRVRNSAGKDRDYMVKMSLLDVQGHSLRLGAARNQTSGLYARGSNGSDAGYMPEPPTGPSIPYYQRLERDSYTMEYAYAPADAALTWKANLYRNENTQSYPGAVPDIADIDTKENGLSASGTWHYAAGAWRNQLTFGVDYFNETAHGTRLLAPAVGLDGGAFASTSRNVGLFLQNRLRWNAWSVSAGARFDDYSAEYGPKTLDGNRVSPNARIEWALMENLSMHVGYAEAVRASGIVPVGFLGRIHAGSVTPGGDLKAETSQQKEIGLAFSQGGLLLQGDRTDVSLKYFDTRIKNMIDVPGAGSVPAATLFNAAPVDVKGWALGLGWGAGSYSTRLAVTIADVKQDGQPLGAVRRVAAAQGNRLVWDHRWQVNEAILLGYTFEAVGRLSDVPAGEPERPGYVLHGLQGEWRPSQVKGLAVKLAIHNLFDKRYANHATLYSNVTGIVEEPGRDIRVALEYQF